MPFALAEPKLGPRGALLVALVALLPDADVLLRVHRSVTHSLVTLLVASAIATLLVYRFKREYFGLSVACCLALLSHPLMDSFQTYTPLLYPLIPNSVWFDVGGSVLISDAIAPRVNFAVRTEPTKFEPFAALDAPIFTSEGFFVSLLLILVPLLTGQGGRR
ncbi:MAG TPA: metal-dependent hydrolase [Chromatiales bacterium]|nr:metal-dependent hydrolase [Chromatiales bacterium]